MEIVPATPTYAHSPGLFINFRSHILCFRPIWCNYLFTNFSQQVASTYLIHISAKVERMSPFAARLPFRANASPKKKRPSSAYNGNSILRGQNENSLNRNNLIFEERILCSKVKVL